MQAGAREGLDAGREATIQAGFDAGFATASRAMQIIQCCHAVLSCLSQSAAVDTCALEVSLADAQRELMALPPPTQDAAGAHHSAQTAQHDALVQRILALKQQVMVLLSHGDSLATAPAPAAAEAEA